MKDESEIDVNKHIVYWRESAIETWKDVEHNLKGGRIAFAMFATHLVIEKILKAHVVKTTKKLPPMIHNLISLANIAGLKLTSDYLNLFTILNPMNIETRYAGQFGGKLPTKKEAAELVKRTKVALEWLIEKL
jgi:HEPN domain-containing protein